MYQQPLFKPYRLVKDLPIAEQPVYRIQHVGPTAVSSSELLAAILQTPDALDLAQEMLTDFGSLVELYKATETELQRFKGIGSAQFARLKAAFELGRRVVRTDPTERPRITSPGDAANLLMPDMMHLDQEEFRVILLNTRNEVLKIFTLYRGSTNSATIRVGEVFREAIRQNAVAIIVSHSHPSGDPSPSPEDVNVTRQLVEAGKQLDIEVLDHVVIGNGRYVSLKERGLGGW